MDNLFKQLKQQYRETKIPHKLETSGWQDLLSRMEDEEINTPPYAKFPIPRFAFILILLLFVFSTGTYGFYQAARKSLPGQPLYPVKETIVNIVSNVSGNRQMIINERAEDLIKATGSAAPKYLDRTLEEYNKSLENLKKHKEETDKEEQKLEKTLKKHEEMLENLKISSSSGQIINKAIENIREIRKGLNDDNKGEKAENNDGNKPEAKSTPDFSDGDR